MDDFQINMCNSKILKCFPGYWVAIYGNPVRIWVEFLCLFLFSCVGKYEPVAPLLSIVFVPVVFTPE